VATTVRPHEPGVRSAAAAADRTPGLRGCDGGRVVAKKLWSHRDKPGGNLAVRECCINSQRIRPGAKTRQARREPRLTCRSMLDVQSSPELASAQATNGRLPTAIHHTRSPPGSPRSEATTEWLPQCDHMNQALGRPQLRPTERLV